VLAGTREGPRKIGLRIGNQIEALGGRAGEGLIQKYLKKGGRRAKLQNATSKNREHLQEAGGAPLSDGSTHFLIWKPRHKWEEF